MSLPGYPQPAVRSCVPADSRPNKSELLEAAHTAFKRNHNGRGQQSSTGNSTQAWSVCSQAPPQPEASQPKLNLRLGPCPYETTFVNKERRFPMYNGERRQALSHDLYKVSTLPGTTIEARLSSEIERLYSVSLRHLMNMNVVLK